MLSPLRVAYIASIRIGILILFSKGLSLLLAPQLSCRSNFYPQVQNRLIWAPEL